MPRLPLEVGRTEVISTSAWMVSPTRTGASTCFFSSSEAVPGSCSGRAILRSGCRSKRPARNGPGSRPARRRTLVGEDHLHHPGAADEHHQIRFGDGAVERAELCPGEGCSQVIRSPSVCMAASSNAPAGLPPAAQARRSSPARRCRPAACGSGSGFRGRARQAAAASDRSPREHPQLHRNVGHDDFPSVGCCEWRESPIALRCGSFITCSSEFTGKAGISSVSNTLIHSAVVRLGAAAGQPVDVVDVAAAGRHVDKPPVGHHSGLPTSAQNRRNCPVGIGQRAEKPRRCVGAPPEHEHA